MFIRPYAGSGTSSTKRSVGSSISSKYSGCCLVTAHSDRLRNQMLSDSRKNL